MQWLQVIWTAATISQNIQNITELTLRYDEFFTIYPMLIFMYLPIQFCLLVFYFTFLLLKTDYFLTYLNFGSPSLYSSSPPLSSRSTPFCLSLKNRFLRDNNKIKQKLPLQKRTKQKKPAQENAQETDINAETHPLNTLESHENTKLEVITYTKKSTCRVKKKSINEMK